MINEDILGHYDSEDIITKEFMNDLQMDSSGYEFLFDQYKYEDDYVDNDTDFDEFSEDDEKLKNFEDWLRYEFEYRFDEQKRTYEIFIVKTGKVVETCRCKGTVKNLLPKLKETIIEDLGVRKV